MMAATVQPTVSPIRSPIPRSIHRIILVALGECREYGLGGEPSLERYDASFYRPGEGILRGAEPLRGGEEYAMALLLGLPEQGDAFDEVALGPETEDLEMNHLACASVTQGEVGDERGLLLGERQNVAARFELPAAGVFRTLPGPDERLAGIVGLALVLRSRVVALQTGRL